LFSKTFTIYFLLSDSEILFYNFNYLL